MQPIDWLGFFGFAVLAASFVVADILWLRALALVSNLMLAVYNYFGPPQPLWVVIGWSLAFVAINAVQIVLLLRERGSVSFSDDEKELYDTVFKPAFNAVEYIKLLRLATWHNAEAEQTLLLAGQEAPGLLLIFNGEVEIRVDGEVVDTEKDGSFIGEMEFINREVARATIVTTRPTRYLFWQQADLDAFLLRNPSILSSLRALFNLELTVKLSRDDVRRAIEEAQAEAQTSTM